MSLQLSSNLLHQPPPPMGLHSPVCHRFSRTLHDLHQRTSCQLVSREAMQNEYYRSNLGVLQPVVEAAPGALDDPYAMQRVTPDSFSSRGYYLDGTAIFGSLVLLVLLLALTFERILGLDRFVNQALQKWKESRQYERRNEVIQARQMLEDSWDNDDPKQ